MYVDEDAFRVYKRLSRSVRRPFELKSHVYIGAVREVVRIVIAGGHAPQSLVESTGDRPATVNLFLFCFCFLFLFSHVETPTQSRNETRKCGEMSGRPGGRQKANDYCLLPPMKTDRLTRRKEVVYGALPPDVVCHMQPYRAR